MKFRRLTRYAFLALLILVPWPIRRWFLNSFFGYKIDRGAWIGLSLVSPETLSMKRGARIGNFNVIINLERVEMAEGAIIEANNWITGHPRSSARHFSHTRRRGWLILEEHSAITKLHHIDCSDCITIGAFSTIAGYGSQLLSHSIDLKESRQDCKPITIGRYTFVGTNSVILGGARLPAYCVLGAKSLLNKAFEKEWTLYGGVPAKEIQPIGRDSKYFSRKVGFVA